MVEKILKTSYEKYPFLEPSCVHNAQGSGVTPMSSGWANPGHPGLGGTLQACAFQPWVSWIVPKITPPGASVPLWATGTKLRHWPGGTLTLESGTGMCRGHDPLFQFSRCSTLFTINVPLMCPQFSILQKICISEPCFAQNFSSQDASFPNFHSQDPSFFKENPLPKP